MNTDSASCCLVLAAELAALRARVEKNDIEIRELYVRIENLRSDVRHVIEDEENEEDERW